jgi:hypothetical protein
MNTPEDKVTAHAGQLLEALREMVAIYDPEEALTPGDCSKTIDRAKALVDKLNE